MQHTEDVCRDSHGIVGRSIITGLRELYVSEILCDATIVTSDKRFPCHRVVLSSVSPYFRVLFVCPMKESESREVSLLDIPSSIMQIMLFFIYTGEVTLCMDNVEELYAVSSRLQIKPMQDLCSRFLMKNLDSGNCLWLYRLALSHNDQSLLDAVMHYINQHLTSLSTKEDFFYLELSELTRILSSDQLMVSSELTIYKLVYQWWEFQSDKGNSLPEKLLKVVRFPLMSPDELTEVNIDIPAEAKNQEFHLRQGMFEDRILCMDLAERDQTIPGQEDYHMKSYDPITDSWEKLPFISPMYELGIVAVDNILYVCGGHAEDNSVSNLLHTYDSIKNEWKELPSMAHPRHGHGFLHYGDVLYAMGGCANRETLSSAECFNLLENCWTTSSSLPVPLRSFASAQFKGRLFLIGGLTGTSKKSSDHQGFLIYDISSDTWGEFPLPVVFSAAGAVVLDDKLYVIASYDERQGDCHAYPPYDEYQAYLLYGEQPSTISKSFCMDHMGRICCSKIPPVLESIALSAVVAWKHKIYIIGGIGADRLTHNWMFYWSPGDSRWTRCDKEIPFSFDGDFGVTLQVPMKHFHALIPGRRLSYNFRCDDNDSEDD
ncbi:BTB And C-terminal Kelch, partial [Pristimantis euphronides]